MMRARSSPRCSVSSSRFSSSRGGRLGRLSSGLAATATGHHTLLTATTSQQYRQSYAPESTRASQYYTTVTPPPFCCVLPCDCYFFSSSVTVTDLSVTWLVPSPE